MSRKTQVITGLIFVALGLAWLGRVQILAYCGIPRFQNQLGLNYAKKLNYNKADIWFEKAARKNLAEGQFNYAQAFELGQGFEKDLKAARYWYQLSADQGYEPAIEALRRLRVKHHKIVLSDSERELAIKICNAWRAFEDLKAATSDDDVAGKQKVVTLYNTYYRLRGQFRDTFGEGREAWLDTDMRRYGLCQDLE